METRLRGSAGPTISSISRSRLHCGRLDDEGRPPLFFWLILITLPVDPNAFVGGRVAAALASGATAGMVYVVGGQLASLSVGVVAAALWAVLPFGVIFGRSASSDDALLALCLALVMWAAIRAVREPSYWSGAVCGAAIALAILAKTLGLLALAIPVCAAVTLARGVNLRRLLRAVVGMVIALVIGVSPLLPWAHGILEKADDHAELDVEQRVGAGPKHDAGYRLSLNMGEAGEYFVAYLGAPTLILAAGGLANGVLQRNRNALFLGLVFAAVSYPYCCSQQCSTAATCSDSACRFTSLPPWRCVTSGGASDRYARPSFQGIG